MGGKTTDLAAAAEDDIWRYDFRTRTWADLTEGRQPETRYLHSAATWRIAPPLRVDGAPGAVLLFGGEHIKSRRRHKKKYVRLNDVWGPFLSPLPPPRRARDRISRARAGYWPSTRDPVAEPGDWVVLIDDTGGETALNLSPFALRGVKVATAAVVVLVALGVVGVAIYYRLGFHFPPDPYYGP